MKKTLLLLIGFAFIFIVIGMSNSLLNGTINPLLKDNIEALADDEWGGGHDDGTGGGTIWYEYEQITYSWEYGPGAILPIEAYWCETHTCHGYGNLFCNGYINCN
jgi:hypothetical protein